MAEISNPLWLGFDFGMKRIGVAVGDVITNTARPLEPIPAKTGKPDWQIINKLIKTWQPQGLVVGIPYNEEFEDHNIEMQAKKFARRLRSQFTLDVEEVDERLSSYAAREELKKIKPGKRHAHSIDSIAAKFILETWLKDCFIGEK